MSEAEEVVLPPIKYYRGDTEPIPITILEGTSPIANVASMVLTVNRVREPGDVSEQLDAMTGSDGGGGVWSFTPTTSPAYTIEVFWYDIQVTYTGGGIKTLGKGTFTVLQDISK